MSRLTILTLLVLALLTSGLAGLSTAAAPDQPQRQPGQPGEGEGRRGRGEGRGGRDFNPEAMRERMNSFFKEQLGVTDEEWKVLQPKIEKVAQARMEAMTGGFGGGFRGRRGGGGGDRGGDSDRPQSAAAKATSDLRQALEANATPDEINKHLTALREARAKARADLEAAQKDLQGVLTPKQEAQLVMFGMLE